MASHPASNLFKRSRRLLRANATLPTPSTRYTPSHRPITILAPGPNQVQNNESATSFHGSASNVTIVDPQGREGGAGGGGNQTDLSFGKPPRDASPTEGDMGRMTVSMAGGGGNSPSSGGDTPLDRIINAMPSGSKPPTATQPESQYQGSSSHPFAGIPLPAPTPSPGTSSSPSSSLSLSSSTPTPFAHPPPHHPFDTHAFVRHMESSTFTPGASRALMRATERLVVARSGRADGEVLHKEDIENAAYLFAAALSELRTELSVRARNDGLALRSTSSLIRREVDALGQRVKEDIGTLKHDIEMDMNNRKAETRTEQKGYDIAIEEINNKFTISIGDLKTEIEQAKWDATRRAITIIAGIVFACISIITLSGDRPAPPPPAKLPGGSAHPSAQPTMRTRDIGVGDEDDTALLERLEGLAALGRERAGAIAKQSAASMASGLVGVGMQSSGFAAGDERFEGDLETERAV